MSKHALKNYIEDPDFINKMDFAFSDLRADYELSMDTDNKKINELIATHVDVKNQLSNLSTYNQYFTDYLPIGIIKLSK